MNLHIGSEIKRVLEEKGITPEWLATQINTSRRNMYDIFSREEISTGMLTAISAALNFDFFTLFSNPGGVEEPELKYIPAKRKNVVVSVELDGMQSTLDHWIGQLTAINQVLNSGR
jgi:hypothetical protein